MQPMKKISMFFFVLTMALVGAAAPAQTSCLNWLFNDSSETEKLRAEFAKNVDSMTLEADYVKMIVSDAAGKIKRLGNNCQSQYFVYVDRNPDKQIAMVCLFDSTTREIVIIGATKVSTGKPKAGDYFITPTGVFENSIKNPSYRAVGTKNAKGWRGLGAKNSRAWDFGWQETEKNGQKAYIRLLMHATDPDYGEQRLGQIASKGCVRVSAKLNKFLDHHGILDKDYEDHKNFKKVSWVLARNREPVALAGKYLIVGDSQEIDYIPELPAPRWEPLRLDPIIANRKP